MTLRVHLARHPARETVDVSVWRKLDRGRAAIFGPITCESKEVEADYYGYSEPSARLTEHELTDLYRSLGDELRRIGSLPAEPSREKVEQMELRIKELKETGLNYTSIIARLLKGTTETHAPGGSNHAVREVLALVTMLSDHDLAVVSKAIRLIEEGCREHAARTQVPYSVIPQDTADALRDIAERGGSPLDEEREYTGMALEIREPDPVTEPEDAQEPTYDSSELVAGASSSGFPCCGGSDEHPPEHTQDCESVEAINEREAARVAEEERAMARRAAKRKKKAKT